MKRIFANKADLDAFMTEIGFTIEDGNKYYWTADTKKASYLLITFSGAMNDNIKYVDSGSNDRLIASYTGSASCFFVIEYFELANGGLTFRVGLPYDSTQATNNSLNFAVVAKDDGSGFVYFTRAGASIYYDDCNGITPIIVTTAMGYTDTSNLVMLSAIYDNISSFIEARAKLVLATQNVSATQLYTFTCAGKKYINGMMNGNITVTKGNLLAFEIPA